MCNQSGPPHFGCVKLSAGDGRFAIAWALFEHINAKIHSSWSGALNKYVATRLDPASPIAPIRFAISTSSLVIGRFGPLTLKKKTRWIPHQMSLHLSYIWKPPRKSKQKKGRHLDQQNIHPQYTCAKKRLGTLPRLWLPWVFHQCPQSAVWHRWRESWFYQWGNVSPRLEACSTNMLPYVTIMCHVVFAFCELFTNQN